MSDADLTQTSVEQDGRILTGVGVTVDDLEATMERHAPPEAEPPQPSVDGAAAPSATEPPKKETRGQKRFAELTGEREAANRRAEAAEKERDELKARIATAERPSHQSDPGSRGVPDPARVTAQPSPLPQATRAKPTEDEVGTKYQTYGEYVEDLADWKAEQRLASLDLDAQIRTRIEADRASRSLSDHVSQAKERGRKVYPDFDAVLSSAAHASANNWPVEKLRAIASLPEPEHVQYALAKDPALAERLRMEADPVQFGMALARLVPADPSVALPASTGIRPVLNLPPPMQPVGSGSKTTALSSADVANKGGYDFDASGYREKRAAERGVSRR